MHKLGLIGGVGPESTIDYYLGITQGVRRRVGRDYFPPLTIESMSCYDVMPLAAERRLDELTDYFMGGIEHLASAGCDVAALCCVTGHIVFEQLVDRSPIPLVSIVDVIRDEIVRRGYRAVLLLGTRATMEQPFLKQPIILSHVPVVSPNAEERTWLWDIISNELEHGVVRDESVARFRSIVEQGAGEGAQAVILGCTELPMLAHRCELPIPAIDVLQLHIDALVDVVMGDATHG
ncbi:aspartate racemase [Olsenella profusa DSM 13989]|uniref:aspartate/glutamate racemase family protein n=1 Tax=Olsenella profusa TaxID=138595 RepID=UPI002783BA09|nr:amino acid racemase [Olsenella profusa]MDP9858573.1 aspartate racemase [Olsenella profusa DSM 13989]